jgi:tetratricopeptide (TPR) repeat protein
LYYYPKNGLALLNIGNYYFRLYDFASSTYFYKKATENAETIFDRISSMNNVAQSYRERTTYAKSIMVFKKTISIINNHSYEMTFAEKDSMMTYTMINSYHMLNFNF